MNYSRGSWQISIDEAPVASGLVSAETRRVSGAGVPRVKGGATGRPLSQPLMSKDSALRGGTASSLPDRRHNTGMFENSQAAGCIANRRRQLLAVCSLSIYLSPADGHPSGPTQSEIARDFLNVSLVQESGSVLVSCRLSSHHRPVALWTFNVQHRGVRGGAIARGAI